MRTDPNQLQREADFHDRWAASIKIGAINVDAVFEGATAPENRYILSRVGDLRGKYVLDLGCGAGENSVYLARKGAHCIAADRSPGMIQTALKLARINDVELTGRIVDAMDIDFPDDTFDIVYASNLLHHVNTDVCIREIWRVLKPGGVACTWDPLRHNPIINIYRRIARNLRTPDEHPLDIGIVRVFRNVFSKVEYDTFWLATLWIFIRFFVFERVDPNSERYWKKIITDEPRLQSTFLRLEKIDHLLKKISFLKRFSWNITIVAKK